MYKLHMLLAAAIFTSGCNHSAPNLKTSKAIASPSIQLSAPIDDQDIHHRMFHNGQELLNAKRVTNFASLKKQLNRKRVPLSIPRTGNEKIDSNRLFHESGEGVLVVGRLYKCNKCTKLHSANASGFVISEDGAIATNYHVVNNDGLGMVAMTRSGEVFPITEVLAANEAADVAILKVDGKGFTPLPLGTEAPIGARVRVISHPDSKYYSLSEGIVSRYFNTKKKSGEATMMAITADFARGSSGGPVFDEYGAVVGMVSSTVSTYYSIKDGHKDNLQMVFKHCVPVRYLRDLIEVK